MNVHEAVLVYTLHVLAGGQGMPWNWTYREFILFLIYFYFICTGVLPARMSV